MDLLFGAELVRIVRTRNGQQKGNGMKLLVVLLVGAIIVGSASAATPRPKAWQWTTTEAAAAIMRQAEDFYAEPISGGTSTSPRDLVSARCRGTGKATQRHFTTFRCTAMAQRGVADPLATVPVTARTRRLGGLCWAVSPAPIPSGCFAPGNRAEGSIKDAFRAIVRKVGTFNHDFRCIPHGSGFYSCSWWTADGIHRGLVVFSPNPIVRILS
jgi:hypothetical protein